MAGLVSASQNPSTPSTGKDRNRHANRPRFRYHRSLRGLGVDARRFRRYEAPDTDAITRAATMRTIVIGGGVMGGGAALALARRGVPVTLIDRFAIGHDQGSSHGYSRIIRFAYFEHPDYVRLVLDAGRLWRELEAQTGLPLMRTTGGLDIGPPDGVLVRGSRKSCAEHGLPHEYLSRSQLEGRYLQFRHVDDVAGVYQPDAGILAASRCVTAQVDAARRLGARIIENERVHQIELRRDLIVVHTPRARYEAERVMVVAGPWASALLAELALPLTVIRKTVGYFAPLDPASFALERFPIFIYQTPRGCFYGLGPFGLDSIKLAEHSGGDLVDPDRVDRNFTAADEAPLRWFLTEHLPAAAGACLYHQVCLYTRTPDEDFIIDLHPDDSRMAIAAGFSGHGFKFGPVVGEILADLVLTGRTDHPIGRFELSRFSR